MKLSQKRICDNCRALNNSIGVRRPCELGFKTEIKGGMFRQVLPLEPCYKPLTIRDYIKACRWLTEGAHK